MKIIIIKSTSFDSTNLLDRLKELIPKTNPIKRISELGTNTSSNWFFDPSLNNNECGQQGLMENKAMIHFMDMEDPDEHSKNGNMKKLKRLQNLGDKSSYVNVTDVRRSNHKMGKGTSDHKAIKSKI